MLDFSFLREQNWRGNSFTYLKITAARSTKVEPNAAKCILLNQKSSAFKQLGHGESRLGEVLIKA